MTRPVCPEGVALLKSFESLHDGDPRTAALEPKLCPTGRWTVAWGHALVYPATGKQIIGRERYRDAMAVYYALWPDGMDLAEADALLATDMERVSARVGMLIPGRSTDHQHAALVMFEYNTGGLVESTVRRKLNAGDVVGAADAFLMWNKGRLTPDGPLVEIAGLTRRRRAERALFLS